MEGNMYKELSYKMQRFRIVSWLIGAVVLLLCLLIGIGCYILVVGMNERQNPTEVPIKEEITIIEGKIRDPATRKAEASKSPIEHIEFSEGIPKSAEEGVEPVAHIQHASTSDFLRSPPTPNEAEIHPNSYKTSFSMRYPPVVEEEHPNQAEEDSILNTLASLANTGRLMKVFNEPDTQEYMEKTLRMLDEFASHFSSSEDTEESSSHTRQKRSLAFGALAFFPYLSYASFGKFVYNQVSEIAQYKIESRSFQARKLGGDAEADFLDGLFWPTNAPKTVKKSSAVAEKDQEVTATETQETKQPWSPMVNQVPIHFVGEILRTLLNLMKEFLMKDHVMECLWFMFCQDVNHQAQHSDMYGILARVNSVGLKVLTESDQQLRESDTFHEIWRSVTAWSPLQCDTMFPRCDGSKALEIVNEVALGSNNN